MQVTEEAPTLEAPTLAPPGPGSWELDTTHFTAPFSPLGQEAVQFGFSKGFAEATKRYGLLLSHLEIGFVNGFAYNAERGVGAPPDAVGTPPKLIFKLLTWFHPEIRRRIRTSRRVIKERAWLADLQHWDDEYKPRKIREYKAFQANDPANIRDAAGLAQHIADCVELAGNGVYGHHRFTVTACVAVGDFLAHAGEWTGVKTPELLLLLRGYSPISAGLAAPELDALVKALRDTGSENLLDGESEAVLEGLRNGPPEVASAFGAYLDAVGQRIVSGYDICDPRAIEMPDTMVRAIRAVAAAPEREAAHSDLEQRTASIRDRVPSNKRELFDQLLADARATYRLRDERGVYNDGWAFGLTRRGVLAAGQFLVDQGRLEEAELLVDASSTEIRSMLLGEGGPDSEELEQRRRARKEARIEDMPPFLGHPPSPPPPAEWLPPHAARLQRALFAFIGALFDAKDTSEDSAVVRGIAVSPGTYEGRARVVLASDDFGRIEQGDVLVARTTSPYINPLLPLLGAIVTDRGGSLSHAAIVAREYGIPGVVGTKVATQTIADGARVRVDGTTGEVTILP